MISVMVSAMMPVSVSTCGRIGISVCTACTVMCILVPAIIADSVVIRIDMTAITTVRRAAMCVLALAIITDSVVIRIDMTAMSTVRRAVMYILVPAIITDSVVVCIDIIAITRICRATYWTVQVVSRTCRKDGCSQCEGKRKCCRNRD